MFVQGVVPELLTNREAHQCLEYEGVFLVVGGYGPAYIYYLHSIYYLGENTVFLALKIFFLIF